MNTRPLPSVGGRHACAVMQGAPNGPPNLPGTHGFTPITPAHGFGMFIYYYFISLDMRIFANFGQTTPRSWLRWGSSAFFFLWGVYFGIPVKDMSETRSLAMARRAACRRPQEQQPMMAWGPEV